jgi:hypothetical protein
MTAEVVEAVSRFERLLPEDGTRPSREMVEGIFAEAQRLGRVAERLSKDLGVRPSVNRWVRFDYSFPSYDEFKRQATRATSGLRDLPQPLFATAIPAMPMLYGDAGTGLFFCNAQDDASTKEGWRHWLGKLAGALGVGELWGSILEVLDESWPAIMKELGENLSTKSWKKAAGTIKRILSLIISEPFLEKLKKKIGGAVASRLIGKVASKFVPFLGWALVVGGIIWAIAEQFI